MSAPTVAVEWLLARAAVRSVGLLHVVSRRDSGALNPVCGANPIRSREIETLTQLTDVAQLCDGCGAMAASLGGTVRDGVALLLGLSAAATTTRLLELPIDDITARLDHARHTPGDGINDLVDSITERGVVTPLIVRRHGRRFEIIDGARRLYAAAVAGLTTVPAIVRDATDGEVLLDSLVANLHRADLNPIDQANAYQHAIDQLQISKAELGRRLGISREQISNTIRLLSLPQEEQDRIAAGELTAEGGRKLLAQKRPTVAPDEQIVELSRQIAELLTVRKVQVKSLAHGKQITITVADHDLARVLAQFGVAA
jgi:ParB/RepB/Spo0J family partition protein